MKFDGKESFRHQANKKRDAEIDIPDKFHIIDILRRRFGIHALTDEAIEIPAGGYCTYRRPDLLDKQYLRIFELDGEGRHGYGDNISKVEHDVGKDHDYDLLKKRGYTYFHINSATTDGYEEEKVVEYLISQGFETVP